jgi:hypothetical protein
VSARLRAPTRTFGSTPSEHEVEEGLLLARELGVDGDLGAGGALLAGLGRERVGHVSEHVEEVALLGVDDPLHLGELLGAEALLGEALE